MTNKKILLTVSVVMLLSVTLVIFTPPVFAQTTNTKYNPSLRVIPGSGPSGTELSIFGTGYPPNSHILLKIDWGGGTYEEDTDAVGSFSFDTTAPDVKPGTYEIRAANMQTTYNPDAEYKTSTNYILAHSSFTITGKKTISTPTPKPGVTRGTETNPPPPPPPQPPTTPTSSASGEGSSSSFFTINPTSGPPGTVVSLKGGGFTGSIMAVFMGGTRLGNGIIHSTGDGSISGSITIPQSAQPGPITISVESSDFTGIAVFTVTGNTKTSSHTTPANTLKTPPTNNPKPGVPVNNGKSTVVPNTVMNSNTSPNSAKSTPNTITKRPTGHPQNSGVTFQVIKGVDGGDAKPQDFSFTVTLTGPSGTAKYPLSLDAEQGEFTAHSSFNLDLPQGSPLSEGTYKIVETDPMGYDTTYSKGCSGTYDNEGYMHICDVVNTKPGDSSYDRQTRIWSNPLPEPQPQPGSKPPIASNTIGKSVLPTTPSKSTISTKSTTPIKPTLPTTKSTGTLTPKTPTVSSCPTGSFAISGKCVSKGAIVAILR